ncbi:MAG: PSD1 domain-containing protein [Planctomycetes bacterium]|nr:PSD1 domain-containing protein [Planctomycetota bacterium]
MYGFSRYCGCCLTLTVLVLSGGTARSVGADAPWQFNRDVRPILAEHCFPCHGPDSGRRQAGLRLDMRDSALEKHAIVPGKPDQSRLIERILTDDEDERMPPPATSKRLSERQIQTLKQWISQGAEYQRHWAYEPPVKPVIPAGQNGIDVLMHRRLSEIGRTAAPPADRRTLIRRLSSDLIGLPPTWNETVAFLEDNTPEAYERLVDRLLASPHYGERMALGWLDVVRFADTIGYHSDNPRNVWPYRDWVITSFNENKPFDRFTIEQIAGDLLPDATVQTRVGSAFNRLLLTTEEGGAQPRDYEARMLTDRVRAIGTAWLGQTTGCAQCHDHKFDPFSTRDFYSLGAFFADIREPIVGHLEEGLPVPSAVEEQRLREFDSQLAVVRQELEATRDQPEAAQVPAEKLKRLEAERKQFIDRLPKCLVSVSLPKPRTVRILPRGNWMDESGPVVMPAVPHYLPQPNVSGRALNRLDLAQWLVSRDNPLTARTVVNRLWKQFFGAGLSKVIDDLGSQGEPPPNPALLDWLAVEFIDSGWDVKHMVRVIVTSDTYRQSSQVSPAQRAADPENREFARQSAYRLDAELIRDASLAVSGLLSREIGGPSVKPYQPEGYWENLNFPQRKYAADGGTAQHRRGLYIWWQRTFLHPSLLAFDAPSREECCAERSRSNIPQQAMVLLNDPTYVEAARALASRILTEAPAAPDARIVWGFQQTLQRTPRPDEHATVQKLLATQRQLYQEHPARATDFLHVGTSPVPASVDPLELAAWTHVARVLLNLHETITRP